MRDASDVGVSLASTWPFLVDALVTAWWYRGRADLARNMAFVSAEAFAVAAAVQGVSNDVASRERPFGRRCGNPAAAGGEIPEDSVDCEPNVRYRSFFSGHATLSFVSAGLLCSNHLALGLLGPPLDALTCAGAFTVGTLTSVFRTMSDMHYASDVLLGAAVGSAAGFLIPWLHYRSGSPEPAAAGGDARSRAGVDLRLGPVGRGLGVLGTF